MLRPFVCLIIFLASVSRTACAHPSAEQLQRFLHTRVDRGNAGLIIPAPDENTKQTQLAHALLDSLWKKASYRNHMQTWVENNPNVSLDDLLDDWIAHYHKALIESLYHLDEKASILLWQLVYRNALSTMNRQVCEKLSPEQVAERVSSARNVLVSEHLNLLVPALANAMSDEIENIDSGNASTPPTPQATLIVMSNTVNFLKRKLSAIDQNSVDLLFSGKSNDLPFQKQCDANWVVSHALSGTTMEDPENEISVRLLRTNLLKPAFEDVFAEYDKLYGTSRPTAFGFIPGSVSIYYPKSIVRNSVVGETTFTVYFDEKGTTSEVKLKQSTLHPSTIRMIDATEISSTQLIQQIIERYYRAGSFQPRIVNGKAVPSSATLQFAWILD